MVVKSNIIGPEDANPINFLGMMMDWKVTADETQGAFSIVEARGSSGTEPPLHYHEDAAEFFYLIEAQMTFKVGDEVRRIGNGGFVWIPRATVHGFIIHMEYSRFLFGFVPAGVERMFTRAGTSVAASSTAEVRDPSAKSMSEADAHRERYGTIVVGPRLSDVISQR